MTSRNALGNLTNRYRSVLKKCQLMNVFGSLAMVAMLVGGSVCGASGATLENPVGSTQIGLEGDATSNVLINNGTLGGQFTPAAVGDVVSSAMVAFGDDINFDLTNNGTISITETGQDVAGAMVIGAISSPTLATTYTLTNNKSIKIIDNLDSGGSDQTFGMAVQQEVSGSMSNVRNAGDIELITTVSDDSYGMFLFSEGTVIAENTGIIKVESTDSSAESAGIFAIADKVQVLNSGTVDVTGSALTHGLALILNTSLEAINSGDIIVKSSSATERARGVEIQDGGAANNMSFRNDGSISVQGVHEALGIDLRSIATPSGVVDINGKGTISASTSDPAGHAYQVWGNDTGYTVNVKEYGIDLAEVSSWTAKKTVFGMNETGLLKLDNTKLFVHPEMDASGKPVLDKQYVLENMVAVDSDTATEIQTMALAPISSVGTIASVESPVNTILAKLDSSNPDKPVVSLEANAAALINPMQSINAATIGSVHNATSNIEKKIFTTSVLQNSVSSGSNPNDSSLNAGSANGQWSMFMDVYGSYTDNSKYDFDASSMGVTAGLNYAFNPQFTLGMHLDLSASKLDSDHRIENESTAFAFGLHANYFVNPNWYVNGQITGSFGSHEMDYKPEATFKDSADFDSFALSTALRTGYIFDINENSSVIPEIGLTYVHADIDNYNFAFAAEPLYDMSVHSTDFSALYGTAKVTWQGEYEVGSGTLAPSVGVGVRQNLTGNDIDGSVYSLGQVFDATTSEDSTALTTTAGLEWAMENFSVGVFYDGAYGGDQQHHKGLLKMTYKF